MSQPAEEPAWDAEIRQVSLRRQLAAGMGGPDKVRRQHDSGRLTVRERIAGLIDGGSFREIAQLTGSPTYEDGRLVSVLPANLVIGRAAIDGRPVVICGDDFTIRGGSSEASLPDKGAYAARLALEYRMPLVQLVDGSGGGGSVRMYEAGGSHVTSPPLLRDFMYLLEALGVVPVVAMAGGSVAGIGVFKVTNSHYSVMVRATSQIFSGGPPLVRHVGEDVTKEELGGSSIQARNGVVSDAADDEDDALRRIARFLSYLPASVHELPPVGLSDDPADRAEQWLTGAIPRNRRRVFDVRRVIEAVVDEGSFFEMSRGFGRSLVTGFARLAGRPVSVIASDPRQGGGGLDATACQKLRRFTDTVNTFNLPRVCLADIPGLMIGTRAEAAGTIRFAAEAAAAVAQTTVPQCTVVLRRFFGFGASIVRNPNLLSPLYAWPSAQWGSLPLEGGIEAAYSAELRASPDPAALRAEIESRFDYARSPFRAAERFAGNADLIDPRETRAVLCEFAEMAYRALSPGIKRATMRP